MTLERTPCLYDLERAAREVRAGHLALRGPTLWRHRDLLPVHDPEDRVSLGGLTGMWKAFEELEAMGFIGAARPRMFAVQAEGCAPIVKAFSEGKEEAEPWPNATTHAHGLRVPKALGDFLILRVLRASHGAGIAVSEPEIVRGVKDAAGAEGLFFAPEGGACVAALRLLKASGHLSANDTVVLFNTGTGFKYVENMAPLW